MNESFPTFLGMISGVFLIAGYLPYLYEIFKKTTVPNRASWFIWCVSTIIILFGVKETGTNEAIWVPIADAVGCSLIFLLSIPYGVGGWSKTDRVALAVCLASLLILWFTGSVLTALLMNLAIYISGYIPTIRKVILAPKSESRFAWILFLIGVVLNLITVAIGNDTGFAVWLYPIVLVSLVGTLCLFLLKPVKSIV